MSTAIKVEGLSKRYWLEHGPRAPYGTLRDEITHAVAAPFRAMAHALTRRPSSPGDGGVREEFWALKDVSFEVRQGDVLGIIGRNGAGKSTLLKILSRITEPTHGRIELNGRVASLLEVGTGFHPELSGRENIFLNGAILGMSRAEIRAKFDEIVAFAEIEKFLDTPVKRYSSGMYVRLAFAVAAHLDPEILVVDEVLAVGDAQFQQKCLGKMRDVSSQQGRTVLFVSHQMGTVRQLCTSAVLLQSGQVATCGEIGHVIDAYMNAQVGGKASGYTAGGVSLRKDIPVAAAWASNSAGEPSSHFLQHEEITLNITCQVNKWVRNAELRLVVGDSRGRRVFVSDVCLPMPAHQGQKQVQATACIAKNFLRPGTYVVSLATFVNNQLIIDNVTDVVTFVVQDAGSKYAASEGMDYGCVFAPCEWKVEASDGQPAEQTVRAVG